MFQGLASELIQLVEYIQSNPFLFLAFVLPAIIAMVVFVFALLMIITTTVRMHNRKR